jgi:hypothetical protein
VEAMTIHARIFKYGLNIVDHQNVRMPNNSIILSVANQEGKLCLWAIVDPNAESIDYDVRIVGTGSSVPDDAGDFIGTVTIEPFVWHVFVKSSMS